MTFIQETVKTDGKRLIEACSLGGSGELTGRLLTLENQPSGDLDWK